MKKKTIMTIIMAGCVTAFVGCGNKPAEQSDVSAPVQVEVQDSQTDDSSSDAATDIDTSNWSVEVQENQGKSFTVFVAEVSNQDEASKYLSSFAVLGNDFPNALFDVRITDNYRDYTVGYVDGEQMVSYYCEDGETEYYDYPEWYVNQEDSVLTSAIKEKCTEAK